MPDILKGQKILFTIDTLSRGGKERQLAILAKNLRNQGVEIDILTLQMHKSTFLDEYFIPKNKVHLIRNQGYLKTYISFKKLIKFLNPDIVFSWDTQTSFYSLVLYKFFGFTFINGSIQHGVRLLNKTQLFRSVVCWLSPNIVANSYAGLKANNLLNNKRSHVLNNGIESKFRLDNSFEKKEHRPQFIENYNNDKNPIIYISVANFVPYKDYYTILKALNELKKQQAFYYIIVGEGPLRKNIVKMINQFGLTKNIQLTGNISNVSDYLNISDVMIHSSRGEGISNAILEGMFAGLPIVASNVGGVPETVWPGSSILFEYRDHKQLFSILKKTNSLLGKLDLDNPAYIKHLEKFSVDNMVSNFLSIVTKIMKDRD